MTETVESTDLTQEPPTVAEDTRQHVPGDTVMMDALRPLAENPTKVAVSLINKYRQLELTAQNAAQFKAVVRALMHAFPHIDTFSVSAISGPEVKPQIVAKMKAISSQVGEGLPEALKQTLIAQTIDSLDADGLWMTHEVLKNMLSLTI